MDEKQIALETFGSGYNCAQAVYSAFSEQLGLSREFALKSATGFGAGMGRRQHVCGAVSGAVMVLSMLYGRGESEPKEQGAEAYRIVRSFLAEFEKANKTIICKDLLDGCELLTDEGQARFEAENMRGWCTGYVESAVEILKKMIG